MWGGRQEGDDRLMVGLMMHVTSSGTLPGQGGHQGEVVMDGVVVVVEVQLGVDLQGVNSAQCEGGERDGARSLVGVDLQGVDSV